MSENYTWDFLSCTDDLGRTLVNYEQVGELRKDRIVAMFYFLWMKKQNDSANPLDNTLIVNQYPEAVFDVNHKAWGSPGMYWWGEPLFGYYQSTDPWVVRRHMQLLSLIGVDLLVFDSSNWGTDDTDPTPLYPKL